MKILITGGTGFIGANLVRRLVADGADVQLLLRPAADKWRIADLLGRITAHVGDLQDEGWLRTTLEAVRPTHLVHLAAYGSYPQQTDVRTTIETNFVGTVKLINAAAPFGYTVINTGSSSEYGLKSQPMHEDDRLVPATLYGDTKAAATLHCSHLGRSGNASVVTLRPFSVYGPYEAPSRLFPTAIRRYLAGDPVVLASPTVARDFTSVGDIVDAYLAALQRRDWRGEVINLASGRQTTLEQFAATLLKVTDGRAKVRWDAAAGRPYDSSTWVGSPDRARTSLGWHARTDLEAGLREMITWVQRHPQSYAQT